MYTTLQIIPFVEDDRPTQRRVTYISVHYIQRVRGRHCVGPQAALQQQTDTTPKKRYAHLMFGRVTSHYYLCVLYYTYCKHSVMVCINPAVRPSVRPSVRVFICLASVTLP